MVGPKIIEREVPFVFHRLNAPLSHVKVTTLTLGAELNADKLYLTIINTDIVSYGVSFPA